MIPKEAVREFIQERVYTHNQQVSVYGSYVKRAMDVFIAILGLILSLPIMVIVAAAILLESKGSAFYVQERQGYGGRSFNVIKMRSMVMNAEAGGAQWAVKNDPRVTKVGAFIRKTRIDELPQFINVLKGEMSIVGPRPERSIFYAQFNREIPGFSQRLMVKPGLTGWAQVNGGYDITPKHKLDLDMHYISNLSLRMDLTILLKTVRIVITGEGAR